MRQVLLDGVINLGILSSSMPARLLKIILDTLLAVLLDACVLSIDRSVSGESVLFCCFWRLNRRDLQIGNCIPFEFNSYLNNIYRVDTLFNFYVIK